MAKKNRNKLGNKKKKYIYLNASRKKEEFGEALRKALELKSDPEFENVEIVLRFK